VKAEIPTNHEDLDMCKKCGGTCCKKLSCPVFPCDFEEITVETIVAKIKSGYCFDYYEGNLTGNESDKYKTFYFIRPKHKGKEHKIVDASWGGECGFLTSTGCSLSEKDRPSGGKALIPKMVGNDYDCKVLNGWNKTDACFEWAKYNNIIEKAMKILNEEKYINENPLVKE